MKKLSTVVRTGSGGKAVKILAISLSFVSCLTPLGCGGWTQAARSSASGGLRRTATPEEKPSPPASAQAQPRSRPAGGEQTNFGAEEEVAHPTAVPDDVLQILRNDAQTHTCLDKNEPPDSVPAAWFAASEIRLNEDELPDLVVGAANPCLFGANIVPFWIFRKQPEGYELVLRVHTLGLDVLDSKTNGYRDIRTASATATHVTTTNFKFDGKEYKARKSWREPI